MVKFVMLLLLFFSVYSWFIVFRKQILFKKARNESEDFLDTFWHSKDLAEAYHYAESLQTCPEAAIFRSGYSELQKIGQKGSSDEEATLEMQAAGMANLKRILQKQSAWNRPSSENHFLFWLPQGVPPHLLDFLERYGE